MSAQYDQRLQTYSQNSIRPTPLTRSQPMSPPLFLFLPPLTTPPPPLHSPSYFSTTQTADARTPFSLPHTPSPLCSLFPPSLSRPVFPYRPVHFHSSDPALLIPPPLTTFPNSSPPQPSPPLISSTPSRTPLHSYSKAHEPSKQSFHYRYGPVLYCCLFACLL